jgi:hypothetical protein
MIPFNPIHIAGLSDDGSPCWCHSTFTWHLTFNSTFTVLNVTF